MSVRLKVPRKGSKAPSDVSTWLQMTRRAAPPRIELWTYHPVPRKLGTWPGNLATLADEVSAAMPQGGPSYGLLAYAQKAEKAFSIAWVRYGVLTLIRETTKNVDEARFLHMVRTLEITGKAMERIDGWRADLGLAPRKEGDPVPTAPWGAALRET